MKQSITLTLDEELLVQAKAVALCRAMSVQALLNQEMVRLIRQLSRYEQSRQAAQAELDTGFHLGGKPAGRDSLYER